MQSALPRPDESTALSALAALRVLDSVPEAEFDALVQVASAVCGTPISLISLVDHDRQWFKARVGLPGVNQTPRDLAFCAHAVHAGELLEVPDATLDSRFADNPLVTGEPDIRFYAGAPLRLGDGSCVGTLCVIDHQPRTLTPQQREVLLNLARAAVALLEGRRAATVLGEALAHEAAMHRALADSQARLAALSEASPLGVFFADPAGRIVQANNQLTLLLGQAPRAETGEALPWLHQVHPGDRAALQAEWQGCTARLLDLDTEFRLVRLDGQVRHLRIVSRPLIAQDGQCSGHVGSMEDVTERLQLRQRADGLLGLVRSQFIMSASDADGRIVEVNDAFCAASGYRRDELLGRDHRLLGSARHDPAYFAHVWAEIAAGRPWRGDLCNRTKTGSLVWLDAIITPLRGADGRIDRYVLIASDITQRREQSQALAQANLRFSLATDSGGIGVWEFDVDTGALHWDAWMCRLFGQPVSDEPRQYHHWRDRVHPDDLAAAEAALQAAIAGEQPLDIEFRVVWPDGAVRHIRATARVGATRQGRATRMVGVNWDVTDLRRLAAELSEQHELLRVTLRSIGDAVITTDAQGCVAWLNPVAERLTGWGSDEARGRPLVQVYRVVDEATRQPIANPLALSLSRGDAAALARQTVLIERGGHEYGIEDSAAPIRNDHGELLGTVLVFHDVSAQRQLSREMAYRATHDGLTGLVNRGEFELRLQRLFKRTLDDRSEHAVLYIDLDQFKLVNDACGHAVGDQLLQQVGRLLAESVRGRDTLARLGGDEFGIILENCGVEQAGRVARKICDRMDDFRFSHHDRRFRIGTSIGLVPVDWRWPSIAAILQAADSACYAAKEAGRNRVHAWFDTDQALQHRQGEMQWATQIEQALDDDRFELHAQRVEPLQHAQAALHAEVLLRMRLADGSLVQPGAFLPAAERFNLAGRIDRWVLRHVLAWLVAQPTLEVLDLLCVNLSGQSVGDRAFQAWAVDQLALLSPGVRARLCLEITETAAVTNLADAARFVDQVRAAGVKVALDDFGAGASSFGYLKSLSVDYLKIDGRFVRDLACDPLADVAVRCFVDVARVVGVRTVAEYVDNASVRERLRAIGIDYAQGFLVHEPAPLHQLLGGPVDNPATAAQPVGVAVPH